MSATATLDKSLDEIISNRRTSGARGGNNRGRRAARPGQASKPATAAPVGGIKKNLRGSKQNAKATPTGPSGREGRVLVTGFVSFHRAFNFDRADPYSAQGYYRAHDQGM